MKTVPLLYFASKHRELRNIEGIANCIGDALVRSGYNVPHLCWDGPQFAKGFRDTLEAREVEFVFVLSQYSLNAPFEGGRVWEHPRFRNSIFVVFLLDSIIYELQPIVLEAVKSAGDRFIFALYDVSGQALFHEFTRAQGCRARTIPMPFGAPPSPTATKQWQARLFEVSFCGNIGIEIMGLRPGEKIEEIFADYKHGPIPYRRLVAAIKELGHTSNGPIVPHLMARLAISPEDLANRDLLVAVWGIDSYFKRERRIEIVKRFARTKKRLHVFGSGWETILDGINNIELHGVKEWSSQDEIFNQSKILLNIEPNTNGGANDRVFSATANGALLLTQRNPVIDTLLVHGDGYLGYESTGKDIIDVIDRPDDELEAIAASGSLKSRALHTWDHRIRDVVDYVRTLKGKMEAIAVTEAVTEVQPEERELVREILNLDAKNDHVGVFTYLKGRSYDSQDALFALYQLMVIGRFQSAFLVAKLLAGAHINNPTIDLARALGGILFANVDDEALGKSRLMHWTSRMTVGKRQEFMGSVVKPVFRQALDLKIIGKGHDQETARKFEQKIRDVRDIFLSGFGATEAEQPETASKRTSKKKHQASANSAS